MKRTILIAALMSASCLAQADEGLTTQFNGTFKFESIFRDQNHIPQGSKNLSGNKKDVAFETEAHLSAIAQHETDMMKYGAKVSLQTSTMPNYSAAYNGSYLFTESDYGRWELGSGFDASTMMRATGCSIARGTCDGWTDYMWNPKEIPMTQTPGASWLNINADDVSKSNRGIETARKVTYFTPKVMDVLQVGVSYIPDTSNIGVGLTNTDQYLNARTVKVGGLTYTNKYAAKDAFAVGATIHHNISDGVDVKLATTGEVGKSAALGTITDAAGNAVGQYKVSSLKTYNIGAVVNYGTVSFAGSYSNRDGFTAREIDGNRKHTKVYTAAAAYNQGPVGVSLMYALGDRQKNKVDSYTLGTDYKLAPGLVPYAEFTYFKGRGTPLPVYNDTRRLTTKGTIALIGAQVRF